MTRAFVAVSPPPEVLDAVGAHVEVLTVPGARFTSREQWHLTLQFLGNHVDLDAVANSLAGLDVGAGPAQLGGAGAFPKPKRGVILWLGLARGAELLTHLAAEVGTLLAPLGYEPDDRPFHPHLTLARCKRPTDLRDAITALGEEPVGVPWTVDEVVLYESDLRNDGARYTRRASVALTR